jgi:hypothetical protein
VHALPAGVDQAADADPVADRVPGDRGADLGDGPGDLVPRRERVVRVTPLAADGVDVGVADPAEGDVDEDVVRADVTPVDGGPGERGGGGRRRVCGDGALGGPIGTT